ncbi:helix-turn-helix transcriptional regulator [Luteimonas sp. RD2P54]|uniref:Helix-turn-helix transcriptional regulator n=1 Tax=Luteimonas endophytica TaxID=3042023 RepID=A0ABT6JA28_9GAMM|nr:helix-turn-helix transcriptional regulator [Luteimonas endophytica]MDH5823681.1 helix-turn-helix transcriptional regulator [Luteimonas endophytica]
MSTPVPSQRPVGEQLRQWRRRRMLSQEDLAGLAGISSRHLSFMETGRSLPSRAMLLRLTDRLDVPLRERNRMFTAAGYAAVYGERALEESGLEAARRTIDLLLRGHEPYPALAVDRHWQLQAANRALVPFLRGVAPALLEPPINVLRLSLHPEGVAPRIVNLGQWRAHLVHRLRGQVETSGDEVLGELLRELLAYPAPEHDDTPDPAAIAVPLRLRSEAGELAFLSTTTVFGTPVEVTLSELAIESFFPADQKTAKVMQAMSLVGKVLRRRLPPLRRAP